MIQDYLQNKINESYEILKLAAEMSKEYYQQPLILTYSGGKDSDVMLELAIECLKPNEFEVMNNHTTVDAPETVYYIRKRFKELEEQGIKATIQYPHYKDGRFKSMWTLIYDNEMPPTRLARYCCRQLKETSIPNRFIAVGVREAESNSRRGRESFATREQKKSDVNYYSRSHVREVFEDDKNRRIESGIQSANEIGVYDCTFITKAKNKSDLICSPIYKWLDDEIWTFIKDRNMDSNPLYEEGFLRVGCIGCPFSGDRVKVLNRYPIYKQNYINAFNRMLDKRIKRGKKNISSDGCVWSSGEKVYKWWVGDDTIDGQMNIYDFLNEGTNE